MDDGGPYRNGKSQKAFGKFLSRTDFAPFRRSGRSFRFNRLCSVSILVLAIFHHTPIRTISDAHGGEIRKLFVVYWSCFIVLSWWCEVFCTVQRNSVKFLRWVKKLTADADWKESSSKFVDGEWHELTSLQSFGSDRWTRIKIFRSPKISWY